MKFFNRFEPIANKSNRDIEKLARDEEKRDAKRLQQKLFKAFEQNAFFKTEKLDGAPTNGAEPRHFRRTLNK